MAQMVKNLPAMQDPWVQFLSRKDPQEKGMATHSRILACRIPWTEEPGGLWSMGSQRVRLNRTKGLKSSSEVTLVLGSASVALRQDCTVPSGSR